MLLLLQELFGIALLSVVLLDFVVSAGQRGTTTYAAGDPGMHEKRWSELAIEAWNQCNEVGEEAPNMGSPRKADCFDIINNCTNPTHFTFIDGSSQRLTKNKDEIEQWRGLTVWYFLGYSPLSQKRSPKLSYATSTQDLWQELESRFRDSNGPMLYEIQREIAPLSQGDMSISAYYTKLKKLWDELAHFTTLPECSSGASKALADLNTSNQLMQFLMGLGDAYDHVRRQVLLIDPLPSIGKAYSMFLRVGKQREVQVGLQHDGAMNTKTGSQWQRTKEATLWE
ncbi:UNVERIFIED_CONTAM: hypothetical protein Sangu_2774900 [Sesamum angustifolium]|uniref:Retrotransposon gag domain-containing protein n=1 Tax=Sesamum angustifolium TaxID=2727405 RepID=A0AAW2IUL7_9LAMI